MPPIHDMWKAKLAAFVHDPAEKALVRLRGPESHTAGTVADLRKELFGSGGIESDLDHFRNLIARADDGVDWRRTFLRFWRLGPEQPARGLGALWGLLPADTRIPDNSIWEHLRLTSAFAGVMALGDTPALLAVSLGPVQSCRERLRPATTSRFLVP